MSLAITDEPALPQPLEHAIESAGATILYSIGDAVENIARGWLEAIAADRDLETEAFSFVARSLNIPDAELRAKWSSQANAERLSWLDAVARAHSKALPAIDVLRMSYVHGDESGSRDSAAVKLRELMSWLPGAERFVLCAENTRTRGLRELLALSESVSSWLLIAVVERAAWDDVRRELDDRSRTLLEQSCLPTSLVPIAVSPATNSARTETESLRDDVARATRAARVAAEQDDNEAVKLAERARSLAELRLYELLQADQVTNGLFQLNEQMPFSFGTRRAEVDLVSHELRIAVEVDGYWHFRELERYRRDRRKDVLLQHQGYIVSRHLAEDVTDRPGEVVRAIRQLVLRRRRARNRENAQ